MSINLNISIDSENQNILINGIPIASVQYVDNEISQINLVQSVQSSVFQAYNGVIITNAYPEIANGTYIQLLEQRKLVCTQNTVRFIKDNLHNIYVKPAGEFYHALMYVEPATSTIFENITTITQPV
jgi:hypothetical protein